MHGYSDHGNRENKYFMDNGEFYPVDGQNQADPNELMQDMQNMGTYKGVIELSCLILFYI